VQVKLIAFVHIKKFGHQEKIMGGGRYRDSSAKDKKYERGTFFVVH